MTCLTSRWKINLWNSLSVSATAACSLRKKKKERETKHCGAYSAKVKNYLSGQVPLEPTCWICSYQDHVFSEIWQTAAYLIHSAGGKKRPFIWIFVHKLHLKVLCCLFQVRPAPAFKESARHMVAVHSGDSDETHFPKLMTSTLASCSPPLSLSATLRCYL